MDRDGFSVNKCFTFTWSIENFSYSWQKNGECILSPVFIVDTMGKTKWRLKLYPKGYRKKTKSFISIYLARESASKELSYHFIKFDLSFLAADGSVLVSEDITKNMFGVEKCWGTDGFVKHDEVLKIRKKDFPRKTS
ncbi:tdpoz2 [Trichonephila clavata]|uniref:Tdpoz2 n=1 Tax=Trichonephila clavata TaxID=2740835 RepID=A0A8X6JGL4_TRICU|nr:tdpoz2 [Trichonephila clavata]